MARQAGDIFIEGTIDNLSFYKMDGKYYVRMKSSLTGKKFWKHKAFERSRESCKRFSEGNKLASKLYRLIDEKKRVSTLFCFLKKRAIQLLKGGRSLIEAEEVLMHYLRAFGFIENSVTETVHVSERKQNKYRRERSNSCCMQNNIKVVFPVKYLDDGCSLAIPLYRITTLF